MTEIYSTAIIYRGHSHAGVGTRIYLQCIFFVCACWVLGVTVINKAQKMFPLFLADAQYKALESKCTSHQQIQRVSSMHRTNSKGVNFGSSALKIHKLRVIGKP